MRRDDVVAAAEGADVVVHAVNPPGYRNWRGLALPMLESSIAAAKAAGARLVLPGTVYNFGPDAFPLPHRALPQNPLTRKGKIRVAMEQRLEAASRDGVRTLIVRAGDFFGPRAGNSWFARAWSSRASPSAPSCIRASRDVGHAWAYLPDLATTIARLLEREAELADFDVFHFGGHWFERGVEMAHAIRRVVGEPKPPIRRFPWVLAYRSVRSSPFPRDARDALPVAAPGPARQRQARRLPGRRAAHPHRRGGACHPGRARLSAQRP